MATTRTECARTRDGRQLHLERRGSGGPVVVFESGMGVSHHMWAAVAERVAAGTATVAYDRSGLGRSAPDAAPRTLDRLADDLVDVLDHLGGGPMVLVGHSWGGPIVRRAAAERPGDVVGLVLVDPTEETCDLFFSRASELQTQLMLPLLPSLARAGLLRVPLRRFAAMLPEPSASAMVAEDGSVASARTMQAELRPCTADLRSLRDRPLPAPSMPVTYLSGGQSSRLERGRRDELVEAHRRAAASLPHGRHVMAERSGHHVPFTEPELVAEEIAAVIDLANGIVD
jgi:pimeloyl-ACP methyl ester carboxylesterase